MKQLVILFTLSLSWQFAAGQGQYYRLVLADKGPEASAFLAQPTRMLSLAAIERRIQQRIPITLQDVPVSKSYLTALRAGGVQLMGTSKWFNSVWVSTKLSPDELTAKFPFVVRVETVQELWPVQTATDYAVTTINYGLANDQAVQLNLPALHDLGNMGSGIRIAVFDSGFLGVNTNTAFSSLRNRGGILGIYDFVAGDTTIYDEDDHGANVLSTIAGNIPGSFYGTAPDADFFLLRTEAVASETHLEEMNWAMAAEWADSAGTDIITSSLGYTTFDPGQGNYTFDDLDGNTTIITQAADEAATKGILVVNSAGNDGNSAWQKVGAPADGDSVLAVGSVTRDGTRSSFSSKGPTADDRIKPDVVALGSSSAVVLPGGSVGFASGTSFSAPIMAGFAASLWSANDSATAAEVRRAIIASSNRYTRPDTLLGYGIPNAQTAYNIMMGVVTNPDPQDPGVAGELKAYPNPASTTLNWLVTAPGLTTASVWLTNTQGQTVWQGTVQTWVETPISVAELAPGMYIARSDVDGVMQTSRVLIVR